MNSKLYKSALVIIISTFGSRILGFVRDMIIANYFGASRMLDGFFVAFRIPNLFRRLVAEGSLTISFVPVYTEYLETRSADESLNLAQKTLSLLLVSLVLLVSLGIIFSPQIVHLFAFGFTDQKVISLTITLNRIMFPYLFFVSIVAFCMGYLNSHRKFFAPAVSPMLLNIGFIFGAVVLRNFFNEPLYGLALGVIIGGIMQLLLQIPYMIKEGFVLKFSIDLNDPGIKRILRMVGAAFAGGAVWQMNLLANTMLASMLPDGSISYLYYSDRLTEFALGIFVISIGNVMLPELSSAAAKNDIDGLKKMYVKAVSASLFFAVPTAVILIVSGSEIISVLFARGKFTQFDADMTYKAIIYATPGIIAVSVHKMITTLFYSLKDTKTPVITAAIAFISNCIFGYFLMQTDLKHGGLTLANSISVIIQVILLTIILRKKIGAVNNKSAVHSAIIITISSFLMGVVMFVIGKNININASATGKIIELGIILFSGGVLYLFICYVFRLDELMILKPLMMKIKKIARR